MIDGVKVVLVTGRMLCAAKPIQQELGLLNSPVISYQGGLVSYCDETLYERTLDIESTKKIIKWTQKNNIHANLYLNDELYVERDDEIVKTLCKTRY